MNQPVRDLRLVWRIGGPGAVPPPEFAPIPPRAKQHFLALDGLRGLAALGVVAFHWSHRYGHGYLAVDFFFLLSGFVVAYAYEDRLLADMSFVAFFKARLIRLYPMVLAGLALGLALAALKIAINPAHPIPAPDLIDAAVRGLLIIPTLRHTPVSAGVFPLDPPFWSLSLELAMNAAYALVVRRLTNRRLVAIVAITAVALVLTAILKQGIEVGFDPQHYGFGFPRAAFSFFAGVGLYRVQRAGRLPRLSVGAPALCGLVLVLLIPALGPLNGAFDVACVLGLFPLVMVMGLNAPPLPRIAPLQRLSGDISYPLYVLHFPIVLLMQAVWRPLFGPDASHMVVGAGVVVGCSVFAYAVLKLYDEPVRRWLSVLKQIGRAQQGHAHSAQA